VSFAQAVAAQALIAAVAFAPLPARASGCSASDIFGAAPVFVDTGAVPRGVTVHDLNGDHLPDLVESMSDGTVRVFIATPGGGPFAYGAPTSIDVGPDPTGVAIADLDGDGIVDMVIASDGGGLVQFHGNGDGTFRKVRTMPYGECWDVIAADVNADGVNDLVVTRPTGDILVLIGGSIAGVPNGTFLFPRNFPSVGAPVGLALADLNNDGALDAVVATRHDYLAVHWGMLDASGPTGDFSGPAQVFGAKDFTYDVTVADFDGDGRLDLASADGEFFVTTYLQIAPGAFGAPTRHTVHGGAFHLASADLNHDGRPDIVAACAGEGTAFAVLLNEGPASLNRDHFGTASALGSAASTSGLAVADLDGDGIPDVAVPDQVGEDLVIYPNQCPAGGLTLQVAVVGAGAVARVPDKPVYSPGDVVTLTATPAPTYRFAGWDNDASGATNPTTVVMDRARFVTALCPPITHTLQLGTVGRGGVAVDPEGSVFHEGTHVGLKAEPALGYLFVSWSGDASSTVDSLDVVMDTDHSYTATFQVDPGVIPVIESVKDVPFDQGGFVSLRWRASAFDFVPRDSGIAVTHYYLWRESPQASLARARGASGTAAFRSTIDGRVYSWEFIGSVPAGGFESYSSVVPTRSDSLAQANPYTLFLVQARDESNTRAWDSPPDSGYSVDDLAPAPIVALRATLVGGAGQLSWNRDMDADVLEYRIHRGTVPEFVPDATNRLATTPDTVFVDPHPVAGWYKVAAVDVHGNVGAFAVAGLAGERLSLVRAGPNPSPDGRCVVDLVLPSAAPARLSLVDVTGRVLARREFRSRGRQSVDLGSGGRLHPGLYWVRLEQGGASQVERWVVLD
jgi:hypothetical protein